ncbi:MAG: nucleoside 2-deoxyribosyltransferase [Anaerolineae bacterium]|nr:nucleoside 2-deoxyribosyltransferase [Anaerolineae bacterium]
MAVPYVYVAGPLFNTHERWFIERIAEALEKEGYRTYVPHRDAGVAGEDPNETPDQFFKRIFDADLKAMIAADFATALLTGQDVDSGTASEIGWLSAKGKPVYGISDDIRGPVNIMLWGFCGEGRYLSKNIDDLMAHVRANHPIG